MTPTNNICELCSQPYTGLGYPIRLSALTSKASWHRDTTFEHGVICPVCAEELNTVIDQWIIKKSNKIKSYKNIKKEVKKNEK